MFPVTQSSVFSVSCGFPYLFLHACVCSLESTGSVKPGIKTNVILLSSSSSMACSMAFNLASAIAAFLFAARMALSCTNFAKWDWRLLSSSASISILSRSFLANNRSNSASCLAAAASAKAFLRALEEEDGEMMKYAIGNVSPMFAIQSPVFRSRAAPTWNFFHFHARKMI